jgi:hypothetical protein
MTTRRETHTRNPARHEYEIERGSVTGNAMVFAGNREENAIKLAVEALRVNGEKHFRLYHTHPSPGPVRRYVGMITPDGVLHRAG